MNEPCPHHSNLEQALRDLTTGVNKLHTHRAAEAEKSVALNSTMDTFATELQRLASCLVEIRINLPTHYITKADLKEELTKHESTVWELCTRVDIIESVIDNNKGTKMGMSKTHDGFLRWGGWILGLISVGVTIAKLFLG